MSKQQGRELFRNAVFTRDNHKCVICGAPAVDAHHIMERRLWPDGGYIPENGASVCADCHILAEQTLVSPDELREKCGIKIVVLPPHLYPSEQYDKWGNILMPDGTRLKGELFHDESVQKILAAGGVLDLFRDTVKYPRTHHLPWSMGRTSDDRVMEDMSAFVGKRVIVTEKMDGENTSLYTHTLHARSVTSDSHPSRTWLKAFWAKMAHHIPQGWRVCGENLYAQHSIRYESLPTYFMGFSIWDDRNYSLNWDDTLLYFQVLGITSVPVLYDGIYDEKLIRTIGDKQLDLTQHEGYVVRVADEFHYSQFRTHLAKFVRQNHQTTDAHWKFKAVKPNALAKPIGETE